MSGGWRAALAAPATWGRALLLLGGLLVAVLLALRFAHLEADFPAGVTLSRAQFSDEGLYSNAAVRHARTGEWYVDGDFNPAVNMPLGQLLHRLLFELFGVSLHTARLLAALGAVAAALLTARLVGREAGRGAGVLAGLFVASHFIAFAYSRVAFMEPVGSAFVAAALVAAPRPGDRRRAGRAAAAGLLAAAAILVKTSMVIALPLVAWAAWHSGDSRRQRQGLALVAGGVGGAVAFGYMLVASMLWPVDYNYFVGLNVNARSVTSVTDWMANVTLKMHGVRVLGDGFLALCGAATLLAAALSADFRRSRLVVPFLAWIVGYFLLLTMIRYGPARYYAPLVFPLAGLAALACAALLRQAWSEPRGRSLLALPVVAAAAWVVTAGADRIGLYLAVPQFTLAETARGIAAVLAQRESARRPLVIGNIADTMALEGDFGTVNTVYGTLSVGSRLHRFRPDYAVVRAGRAEDPSPLPAILLRGGRPTLLGTWHPMTLNYGGGPVHLYAVTWPARPAATGAALP